MRVNVRDTFTECRYSNEVAITLNISPYKHHDILQPIIHIIIIQLSSITIGNVIEIHSFINIAFRIEMIQLIFIFHLAI